MLPQRIATDTDRADLFKLVTPAASLQSPSLSAEREVPAYELKFLLTEAQARAVEDRARAKLVDDSHADPAAGHSYQTTSLYCDTARFDVFHRAGPFKRRKHRVRRYGWEPVLFLERKTKWGDRVKKRRTEIPVGDLPLFASPQAADWPGHWFQQHLCERGLAPVCRLAYERVALVGESIEGPLRLTFDRHIRGALTEAWELEPLAGGLPVLTEAVICEFKYQAFLPVFFKDIIQSLRLSPSPVSKYRAFLRASGRVADRRAVDA